MKPQNFVADVIYLDFAYLIRVYDASYSQKNGDFRDSIFDIFKAQ